MPVDPSLRSYGQGFYGDGGYGQMFVDVEPPVPVYTPPVLAYSPPYVQSNTMRTAAHAPAGVRFHQQRRRVC